MWREQAACTKAFATWLRVHVSGPQLLLATCRVNQWCKPNSNSCCFPSVVPNGVNSEASDAANLVDAEDLLSAGISVKKSPSSKLYVRQELLHQSSQPCSATSVVNRRTELLLGLRGSMMSEKSLCASMKASCASCSTASVVGACMYNSKSSAARSASAVKKEYSQGASADPCGRPRGIREGWRDDGLEIWQLVCSWCPGCAECDCSMLPPPCALSDWHDNQIAKDTQ
eukprot:2350331-Amphidinium_carterae.1